MKQPVILRGIAQYSGDLPGLMHFRSTGGFAFAPESLTGPAAVKDRPVQVILSRRDLARLLGEIPAVEFADPDLMAAHKRISAFLRGE